jgi:hypothetical protein
MKKIKITLEMGDEVSTLSLNTNKDIIDIINHIALIRSNDDMEEIIKNEILHDMGGIYESPDFGNTIYIKKKIK